MAEYQKHKIPVWLGQFLSTCARNAPYCVRRAIFRFLGVIPKTKKTADVAKKVYLDFPSNVKLGVGSGINRGVTAYTGGVDKGKVIIGDNSYVGMDTKLICISHELGPAERRLSKTKWEDIIIGNGVWIGANCTILPGVHVGDGVVIGAGSVVVKDCQPNCLYAGNPAKKIKELPL